jgi:hypothetical protein
MTTGRINQIAFSRTGGAPTSGNAPLDEEKEQSYPESVRLWWGKTVGTSEHEWSPTSMPAESCLVFFGFSKLTKFAVTFERQERMKIRSVLEATFGGGPIAPSQGRDRSVNRACPAALVKGSFAR